MRVLASTHAIDTVLRHIGINGFDGVTIEATSTEEAFRQLLGDNATYPALSLARELRRQELAEVTKTTDGYHVRPTIKGLQRLQLAEVSRLSIVPPKSWDGSWQLVLLDIPARLKAERYQLLAQLKRLGFVRLRTSAWVYPYHCPDELAQLIQYCNLTSYVSTAIITKLDAASQRQLLRKYPALSVAHPASSDIHLTHR